MTPRKAPKRTGSPSGGPVRALGYVRVSTGEQADSGLGLAAQQRAVREACRARGYRLLEVVEDAGYSAATLDRPGIASALERLDAGEADAIVVAKLDRLSRSLLDFAALMERSRAKGWAVVGLDLGVDTTTPAGEMMANVLAVFAQFERRVIGQRTREALAAKRAQGVRLGRPQSLPDEVVARIVADRARGLTLQAIADRLGAEGVATAHGGKRWYPSTIRDVLHGQAAAGVGDGHFERPIIGRAAPRDPPRSTQSD
ncbi:MAG: recombinase family protein [Acidimicrobiales bacterium]